MTITSSNITVVQARGTCLAISVITRSFATSASRLSSSQFRRSDFTGQPFTGSYEPGQPTVGPLGGAAIPGTPSLTPKVLKHHLDQFVVGQERAKKVLSVAVYNHYQRIEELRRREEEEAKTLQERIWRERADFRTTEDEYTSRQEATPLFAPVQHLGVSPIIDSTPLTLEKTNILLLGPSGVGKTLMTKTLARILAVPFSMSDCTPFTQAGYIGEDAQICVERLLAAANYDVRATEQGIICLDEVDKIATVKTAHGKDVGGEGVQQALLKIIEGTTLQFQSKHDRSNLSKPTTHLDSNQSTGNPMYSGRYGSLPTSTSSLGGANSGSSKGETYSVRTDNILFIFTGAFIGLHKMILSRISKGSIGFGSPIRFSTQDSDNPEMTLSMTEGSEESKLFQKHFPFFTPLSPGAEVQYNPLDFVEPSDLQRYGMIPELVGRIPVTTALSALDEDALIRVLTEPRNSIMKQYVQLFQLNGVELRFTSGALKEVARNSLGMGTGARGLRTCVERILSEAMFEAPGSSIKHILVTKAAAQMKQAPTYFARGQQPKFQAMSAAEEENTCAEGGSEEGDDQEMNRIGSFEEYREL